MDSGAMAMKQDGAFWRSGFWRAVRTYHTDKGPKGIALRKRVGYVILAYALAMIVFVYYKQTQPMRDYRALVNNPSDTRAVYAHPGQDREFPDKSIAHAISDAATEEMALRAHEKEQLAAKQLADEQTAQAQRAAAQRDEAKRKNDIDADWSHRVQQQAEGEARIHEMEKLGVRPPPPGWKMGDPLPQGVLTQIYPPPSSSSAVVSGGQQ